MNCINKKVQANLGQDIRHMLAGAAGIGNALIRMRAAD
jgi:hypothetical protein